MRMDIICFVAIVGIVLAGNVMAQSESRVPAPAAAPDSSAIIQSVPMQQAPPSVPLPTETIEPSQGSGTVNPIPTPSTTDISDCNCNQQPVYSAPMSNFTEGLPSADCGCVGTLMNYSQGYSQPAMDLWSGYRGGANRYSDEAGHGYGRGCGTVLGGRSYGGGFWQRPAHRSTWFGRRCGGY